MKAKLSGFLLLLCLATIGGRAWGDDVEVRGFRHVGNSWRQVQSPESSSGGNQPLFGCSTSLRTIDVTKNPKTQQLEYTSHDYKAGDWMTPSLHIASGTLSGKKGRVSLGFEDAGYHYDLKGRYDTSPDASLTVSQSGQVVSTETCESFFVNSDLLMRLWEQQGHHYIPVRSFSMVLASGDILLIGKETSIIQLYDAKKQEWSYRGIAPYPSQLVFTPLKDDRVLAVGGQGEFAGPTGPNVTLLYDPTTNKWEKSVPMTTTRYFHSDLELADGRVLVAGYGGGQLATAEIFDPKKESWSSAGSLDSYYDALWGTPLQDGRALLQGRVINAKEWRVDLRLFDPKTTNWTTIPSPGFHGGLSVQAQDGSLFIFIPHPNPGVTENERYAGVLDLKSYSWIPYGAHPYSMSSGLWDVSKNRLFLFNQEGQVIGFSMQDHTWRDYRPLPIKELSDYFWACETLPSGKILFAGRGNLFDETGNWEIYDPDAK